MDGPIIAEGVAKRRKSKARRGVREIVAAHVDWAVDWTAALAVRVNTRQLLPWRKRVGRWSAPGDERHSDAMARDYVRAVVCASMALRSCGDWLTSAAHRWTLRTAEPYCREILCDALAACGVAPASLPCDAESLLAAQLGHSRLPALNGAASLPGAVECPELLLTELDRGQRAAQGFYVTPAPLARFIVDEVHAKLRDEFGLARGLADTATWNDVPAADTSGADVTRGDEPFVRILDPAVGSGAFLVAAIECIHDEHRRAGQDAGAWSAYVADHLLRRLVGIELLPAAAVCAHVAVTETLAHTGFDFAGGERLRIYVGDALAPPKDQAVHPDDERFTVVVGNPPFLAAALPGHRWIEQLLKGRGPAGEAVASYYEAGGAPLAERKLWLHDDYVKFFRYAQWRLEESGCGILGFVTNHGYLDNATFRGMREKLLGAFPRIAITDLHGNRKKKERPPAGRANENVFAIEQGTAVALLRRPPICTRPLVEYRELWGTRVEKLAALQDRATLDAAVRTMSPAPPGFFFTPRDDRLAEEYARGWRLTEVMPVNTTAPVTARDGFVVAFERDELLSRIGEFRDLAVPDDEIRERYFHSTRSVRFDSGDTRGWKLAEARRRVTEDAEWRNRVRECLYRPFDVRSVYWTEWMIDWPRSEVMRHLEPGDNLALIARRQMPPGEPCSYFWVTRRIALDGVIRSDNRGSESLFPLYLNDESAEAGRRVNLADGFLAQLAASIQLDFAGARRGDLTNSFGAEDVGDFIYALFSTPSYRIRYAELLPTDFPRVFLPGDAELFRRFCETGRRLVALHTMTEPPAGSDVEFAHDRDDPSAATIAAGYPKYADRRVPINRHVGFSPVSPEVWNFRAGGHQACRKWLKDRRGRTLTGEDIAAYCRIVAAIAETLSLTQSLDAAIAEFGGWPSAFALGPSKLPQ